MIVVTGAAGFIGSQLVKGLNEQGFNNILVVDDLEQGDKFINLRDNQIADYKDKDLFRKGESGVIEAYQKVANIILDDEDKKKWKLDF